MTDNEIIKALEYCNSQGITSECEKCKVKKGCRSELLKNALDLINRQKSEIERLRTECGNQSALWSKHYEDIFETTKETIEAEAIKELADRVKARSMATHKGSDGSYSYEINNNFIDNLVKEMVGDNNG